MSTSNQICRISNECPGCQLWGVPFDQQIQQKVNHLYQLFQNEFKDKSAIEYASVAEYGLRQRFDFVYKNNSYGLINNSEIIPIEKCLQLNPQLQDAYLGLLALQFSLKINIRIGSIRLRVSPHESKAGLWLDFANTDIKNLLVEKTTLQQLSEKFFIEVGQKRKSIDFENSPNIDSTSQLKLKDPVMKKWFSTLGEPLNCYVGSFTQPSSATADVITETLLSYIDSKDLLTVWEFGCGIGQYTIPLLKKNHTVHVFENDLMALDCLKENAKQWSEKLVIHNDGDKKTKPNVVVVNPARSGLKEFTGEVCLHKPDQIIYVSCFPESLKADSEVFFKNNYKLEKLKIVDQFPQTHHYEVVALFQRIDF